MTVEEFYATVGGNYSAFLSQIDDSEIIKNALFLLLEDDNFNKSISEIKAGEIKNAFIYMHTFKGVCQNLFLEKMYEKVSEATEMLRSGKMSKELINNIEGDYAFMLNMLKEIN